MFNSCIKDLIIKNKNLFEDVNRDYTKAEYSKDEKFTILDYRKIFDVMYEYVTGYFNYKRNGEEKYSDRVFTSTHRLYDSMFSNPSYRKEISLFEMKDISKEFLTGTKKIQDLVDQDYDPSSEQYAILKLTDNQYRKLMKVFTDDMKIYLWLSTRDSTTSSYPISDELLNAFVDQTTPVIHRKRKQKTEEIS